jgi:hypothetical protein
LIQMGDSSLCPSGCTDVGISDLRLDGCPSTWNGASKAPGRLLNLWRGKASMSNPNLLAIITF